MLIPPFWKSSLRPPWVTYKKTRQFVITAGHIQEVADGASQPAGRFRQTKFSQPWNLLVRPRYQTWIPGLSNWTNIVWKFSLYDFSSEGMAWVQSPKKRKGSNSIRDVMRLPVCWLRQPMLEILRMSHAQVGMEFRQKYAKGWCCLWGHQTDWLIPILG